MSHELMLIMYMSELVQRGNHGADNVRAAEAKPVWYLVRTQSRDVIHDLILTVA